MTPILSSSVPRRLSAQPPDEPARKSWLPATFRALRHYNYQLYFFGQIVSLGGGLAVGALVYLAMAKLLRISELEQITRLLRRRFPASSPSSRAPTSCARA